MSLKLNERYPGRFKNPSPEYPLGSFKNRTAPNAKDGSYLEQDWANDKEGFFQSLLSAAGIDANGSVDKVGASQFYDAFLEVIQDHATTPQATESELGGAKVATQEQTDDGTDDATIVTPKKLAVKLANGIETTLGYNQTTQNMTGSRAANVTYTNSTGRPIFIIVQVGDQGGSGFTFAVNGVVLAFNDLYVGSTPVLSFIIPPGGTYGPLVLNGNTLAKWMELR